MALFGLKNSEISSDQLAEGGGGLGEALPTHPPFSIPLDYTVVHEALLQFNNSLYSVIIPLFMSHHNTHHNSISNNRPWLILIRSCSKKIKHCHNCFVIAPLGQQFHQLFKHHLNPLPMYWPWLSTWAYNNSGIYDFIACAIHTSIFTG